MSSQDSEDYLAVLKASYDYSPQSDDEIAIKEDQILLLIERVDEDWWKVKIKGNTQEEDTPVGLVPAAYVEQADHTSVVKALYDYEASAGGELTIKEDEILLAFDTEEEWLLVQSTAKGGKAGFVPANYVEPHNEGEGETSAAPQIVIPPDPPRPVSTYVDPAERVANAKANTDDIKTWSVSEVDKKGKKLKGTLGVGNGAVFFASETSKAAVQKWQTADITNIAIDKKQVTFDIGGTNPTSLHFHAGSKDNAEAIVEKLESSKALSAASQPSATADTPKEPPKKPSVHFSPASPTIIPPREPSEDGDYEEQEEAQSVNGASHDDGDDDDVERVTVLYDFTADGDDELTVSEGEQLVVLEKDGDEWWKCRNQKGREGVVPASYIEVIASNASSSKASAAKVAQEAAEAQARAEAQRRAEEARAKAEAEANARAEAEAKAQAEAERAEREEEERKARKKQEAKQRAEAAQAAADAERRKRQEAAAARAQSSPPPSSREERRRSEARPSSSTGNKASDNGFPPAEHVRTWHDRSGQFRVDAALLNFKDGKLRLHKTNGVIVEVPSEKMSLEDMKYIEKTYNKKPRPKEDDDDNIPLAQQKRAPSVRQQSKKGPTVDWFDFFLSAGCDLDDCTRYAASFERDKIDEAILPDITESTMRSLGLREGDIIRVKKTIESRKPPKKDVDPREAQIANDEALARQLEAQDKGGSSKAAPNLFASGPGGALKATRRGRPQPSKSLPPSVDLNAINTVSEQIQRTSSPSLLSPDNVRSSSTPVQPPPRSSSALPATSGFEDDAWTNRPSSTKPLAPTPPATTARAPSAPPTATAAPTTTTTAAPATASSAPAPVVTEAAKPSSPKSLANTTESDIFDQLARLSELRKNTPVPPAPAPQAASSVSNPTSPPPPSFMSGLGINNSPLSMGQHVQNQQTGILPQSTIQPYNGPRGPFAPVPANQALLRPLIPTQTGFGGFVPTRPGSTPSFLNSQPTGMPGSQLMMNQPTGIPGSQPLMSQPTGMPFGGFNNPSPFQNNGGLQSSGNFNTPSPIMSNPTGFSPNPGFGQSPFNQSPFNNAVSSPPPLPSSNAPTTTDTNPANIFAQMKSGTFANDNQSGPQASDKYDALRPNPMVPSTTGWGNFQGSSFVGYR
ncbi:cytoskeleton assembly control protein sla1 [Moniliophthora roreri MCA 2997]|uniref:Actin cytoskeleton-regulatory complex protein SLA1 n=1 Tax=Moniliophthora roreri (strain MCA 2997) TaxID=1381753 RepID=V2Z0U8_MONRO|nr:cytoskeleton assembly control protein sla1 [Moniliophthora roreri MCA 2997]